MQKSFACAALKENIGNVAAPNKNIAILNRTKYLVFIKVIRIHEIKAKMLKPIKTYLLSYLSASQPAGTWLIAPPKIPKKRKNATWVMFRPEYDAVSYTHLTLPTKRIV